MSYSRYFGGPVITPSRADILHRSILDHYDEMLPHLDAYPDFPGVLVRDVNDDLQQRGVFRPKKGEIKAAVENFIIDNPLPERTRRRHPWEKPLKEKTPKTRPDRRGIARFLLGK